MEISLDELADSFARSLRAEMKAARTIKIYAQSTRFFGEWLTNNGLPATLEQLTRDNIRQWLGHLGESHEASTVKTRFSGLRRFCGWLVAEGELDVSPMAGLSPPEPQPKPVPVLEDDELVALLKTCSGRTFEDRRDEAILRVLLDAGIRVSELIGLTVTGVDLDREMAMVTGKGNKVRPVYFGTRTVRALDRYLRERRKHRWAHLDALFIGQRGAMSTDGARERVRVRTEQAGLTDRMHPHRFRHTWAHDYLVNGGQERDLKRLAGWTSDTMLERYGSSAADMRAREATRRMRRGDRV
jgi:site-specific recombinase XerD